MAERPRPLVDADSLPFWEGCNRNQLLGQRCSECDLWRWPPRSHCPQCHAQSSVWDTLIGEGVVLGFVVVHRPMDPAFADEIPLAIIHVEMDGTDGEMVLISNLLPGEWERCRVGSRVRAVFVPLDTATSLPKFTLI